MLYDPKWESEVKADPFSLSSLVAWLEKQPADKEYCYVDTGRCLLCQYFSAMGFKQVTMTPFDFCHAKGAANLPDGFDEIAQGNNMDMVRTFGAALARAKAVQS